MNDTITLADWHTFHQLDSGIYGYMAGDATRPQNPALTMATPRIVTLNPGQVIFRWCHSGMPVPAASPWWATKRGAQAILRKSAGGDTAEAARAASNVARSWNSDLGTVVFATVIGAGVKAFSGDGSCYLGRADPRILGLETASTLRSQHECGRPGGGANHVA